MTKMGILQSGIKSKSGINTCNERLLVPQSAAVALIKLEHREIMLPARMTNYTIIVFWALRTNYSMFTFMYVCGCIHTYIITYISKRVSS